jgi:signal peptidase II
MARSRSNGRVFWGLGATIVLADAFTKMVAVDQLVPSLLPREVVGDALRLTLVYNPGAAFGLHLGPFSRWIFTLLTLGALALLWRLYQGTQPDDRLRTVALSLVCGGAVGNLVDRLKSARGVVDFIDVGVGVHRWPTFNVADMAVSCGALLLAYVLWREDAEAAARATSGRDAPVHG